MSDKPFKSNYTFWLSILTIVIILIITAATIAGCATHPSETVATTPQTGNKIGDLAPDFSLPTIDNKMMSLHEYMGKNIILNFWATWCGPCVYEVPFLREIDERWSKAGVMVIAINTQDSIEAATSYARHNNLNFVIPFDPRGGVASLYNVRGLPTSFFIDSEGVIKSIKVGPFISTSEIEERMKSFK